MRNKYAVLPAIMYSVMVNAQVGLYEQMKGTLNEESLPLVNLIVDTGKVNRNYVQGEIEIVDYLHRTNPESETVRYQCKLRHRGGMASTYDKKAFAVKLLDEAGEDLDANIFGIREENSWILDAMAIDRIRMRNRICFDVWNDMSQTPYETKYGNRNGTKGVFVEVFINGDYNGLYCMTDKIDRKLLSLKKAKADASGDVAVRGLLYKGNGWGDYTDIYLLSYKEDATNRDTWNGWELQYPDDYPSIDTWQPLMDLIDFCSDQTTDDDFQQLYEEWFYSENLADYVAFTLALNVGDNVWKNTFLSVVDITKGHRYMVTPWDMDMSLGGHWSGTYNKGLSTIGRYDGRAPFNRLTGRNIDGFVDRLTDTWKKYYTTLFSPESIGRRIDAYAAEFVASGAWRRELDKWNGNPVPLKEQLSEEIDYVKNWYAKNYESLCEQFGTPPETAGITNLGQPTIHKGVYMLDGRKMDIRDRKDLSKGVYIIDGRKILIR